VSDEDQQGPGRRRLVAPAGLPIGRVLGVPIIVQPLWFVIVVIFTASFGPTVRDAVPTLSTNSSYAIALLFVLLLYASVLVHEIGHVVVAKLLGMQVNRVVLQFLGGASEVVEENPGKPSREFMVAAVGPLTSVLLGGIGFAIAPHFPAQSVGRLLADGFGWVNAVVAAFNLLPGLPLDGGRVLRAIVWQLTHDKLRATVAAGWVGRAVAVAVALYGLGTQNAGRSNGSWHGGYGGLYLLVLAFFIWTNASMAIAQTKVMTVLPKLDLRAMTRRALPVSPDLPVAEAVRRARDAQARGLVVVDAYGRPSGLVSEAAVSAMPEQRQPWVPVSDLARPVEEGLLLRTDMTGENLLRAVQTTPATEYLVLDPAGQITGVLSRTDLVAALQAAGLK
jgi:Zn-dependent protease/CBS domain-containing protein